MKLFLNEVDTLKCMNDNLNIGYKVQSFTGLLYALCLKKHRVMIPEDEVMKRKTRQSIAFFVHPDDEIMIEGVCGVMKYQPTTSKEYTKLLLDVTY